MLQELINYAWIGIVYAWKLIVFWWWFPLFFWCQKKFIDYWKWWRIEIWYGTIYKPVLLEIKIPKEILKPIKAMEAVFVSLHGAIYNPQDFWEKYVTGEPQTGYHFEIISIGGQIHFYVRCHSDYRDQVEAAIYSQYPEAEIEAVPDYSKQVPLDIPNKEWDLFGWDYYFKKPNQFPIPTYEKYEEGGEEEEVKVDPLVSLLESMAKLRPGEQMWLQISTSPKYQDGDAAGWVKKGEVIRDELAKREKKAKSKSAAISALDFIVLGSSAKKEEKAPEIFPAELRLTAGEKETLDALERKLGKPVFGCRIRNIYLGKRDTWFKPNFRLLLNYFNHFQSPDLNSLDIWGKSLTRIKKSPFLWMNLIADRREYLKKRHLFRAYRDRVRYNEPWGGEGDKIWLNVEELATLYHFPSATVAPTPGIHRTEAKETVAPHNLPV